MFIQLSYCGTLWRRTADVIEWHPFPQESGRWLLKKGWGPVNVFSTGWRHKGHLFPSYCILFSGIAVSTTNLKFSRMVAFFHTEDWDKRQMFSGFRSASITCSQVWLGLPIGYLVEAHKYYAPITNNGSTCFPSTPVYSLDVPCPVWEDMVGC